MNKKIVFCMLFLLSLCPGLFTSCDDDDDDKKKQPKPTISFKEIGSANSKTVKVGSDLHLDAEIIAEGVIKQIHVDIQQEGGKGKIDKVYTDSKHVGAKSFHFHEHINIPAATPVGKYKLRLTVTDRGGQTSKAEADLKIEAAKEK